MQKVAIVTDGSSDLPKELIEKYYGELHEDLPNILIEEHEQLIAFKKDIFNPPTIPSVMNMTVGDVLNSKKGR